MKPIRLLIVDDHAFYRESLRVLFDGNPETEVVGEAAGSEEALAKISDCYPHVVLMDIQMPGESGIEATRHIVQKHPQVYVIMLTMFGNDDTVFAAMRAGARGYILKGAGQKEMLQAVHTVAGGQAVFDARIAARMLTFFDDEQEQMPASDIFPDLTERERQILTLIAQGVDNATIAGQLAIRLKTVQNHVSTICNKLQVVDRSQALLRAREAGLA